MKSIDIKKVISNAMQLSEIVLGCIVFAFAYNFFFIPVNVAPGGFTGFATIINYLTGFPIGVFSAILNIPLFFLNYKFMGKKAFIYGVCTTLLFSSLLEIIPVIKLSDDLLLCSVLGGACMGVGAGLVIRGHSTTGGTDLAAQLLSRVFKRFGIGTIIFVLDFIVVLTSGFIFDIQKALYAFIGLYISSRIVDTIQEGVTAAKQLFIISESNSEEIARRIMDKLGRGVTNIDGIGMYSGNSRKVLMSVVSRNEIVNVKEIVQSIDPQAFVIVNDSREIMGRGFTIPMDKNKRS